MSLEFSPTKKYFDYFESEFEQIILTTFEFDSNFFEAEILPRLVGRNKPLNTGDILEIENALENIDVSVITSGNMGHAARRRALGYDLYAYNGIQHSKVAVLANKGLIRIIVGSVNLTESAFCRNLEAFCVFDFTDRCSLPKGLADQVLDYLSDLVDGREKLTKQVLEVKKWLNNMDFSGARHKSDTMVRYLAYPNRRNEYIIDQMLGLVGKSGVKEVKILTPFFESGGYAFFKFFIEAFSERGAKDIDIFFPSKTERKGQKSIWQIGVDNSFLGYAETIKKKVHFYPILPEDKLKRRNIHAKILYVDAGAHIFLLIGSSNFTKKGLGYHNSNSNAEANMLFRISSRDFNAIKNFTVFFYNNAIKEQGIEFLCPYRDNQGDPDDNSYLLPQIIKEAEYKNGKLTVIFSKECFVTKSRWAISLSNDHIVSSANWRRRRRLGKKINNDIMACGDLELKVEILNNYYFYPITFKEFKSLIIEKHKDFDISLDSVTDYWLNQLKRPQVGRKYGNVMTHAVNSGGLIDTPDILTMKIRGFVRALDGVRNYLSEDRILNNKMLENRISGIYGIKNIFRYLDGCADKTAKLFCYSELLVVIKDILSSYKNKRKAYPLKRYQQTLLKEVDRYRNKISTDEWMIYSKGIGRG